MRLHILDTYAPLHTRHHIPASSLGVLKQTVAQIDVKYIRVKIYFEYLVICYCHAAVRISRHLTIARNTFYCCTLLLCTAVCHTEPCRTRDAIRRTSYMRSLHSLQVAKKTNLSAELKHQAPN